MVGRKDAVVARCSGQLKAAALLETRADGANRGRLEYLLTLTLTLFPKNAARDVRWVEPQREHRRPVEEQAVESCAVTTVKMK